MNMRVTGSTDFPVSFSLSEVNSGFYKAGFLPWGPQGSRGSLGVLGGHRQSSRGSDEPCPGKSIREKLKGARALRDRSSRGNEAYGIRLSMACVFSLNTVRSW